VTGGCGARWRHLPKGVVIPVADVDRAKCFYGRLGWRLDADVTVGSDLSIVPCTEFETIMREAGTTSIAAIDANTLARASGFSRALPTDVPGRRSDLADERWAERKFQALFTPPRRPRPPARPAARRHAGAYGLDRHRRRGEQIAKGILHALPREFYTRTGSFGAMFGGKTTWGLA
jgi:hypothetical protein